MSDLRPKLAPVPLPAALVLDLDGTLADTEPLHDLAWDVVLRGVPRDAVAEERKKWIGLSSAEIARELRGAFHLALSVDDMLQRKRACYRKLVRQGLQPFPGLTTELCEWAVSGVPVAVATSGSRREAILVLKKLRLPVRLATVVTCEDVLRTKPAPDCYLLAAGLLGKSPKDCAVIEDSINGLMAAVAAGCRVFGVSTGALESLPAGVEGLFPSTVAALRWLREGSQAR
jgi:HAD superfamily hydrolase (TIGR01509 family)